MRCTLPSLVMIGCLAAGAAWAQSSSSSGSSTSSSGAASGTAASPSAPSPASPTTPLPRPQNSTGSSATTPPQGATSSAPIPPPGNESSTAGPGATGSVQGGRRVGQPSSIGPSSREEELLKKGEQIEQRARRLCDGC
jgi:hypothetical protein